MVLDAVEALIKNLRFHKFLLSFRRAVFTATSPSRRYFDFTAP
jgi:hypothetical protein